MKLKNELNSDVLAVLIRDMASEFIKSRSPAGEGVGAYVDKRYPNMTAEQKAEKEKQVIGRCELAQNIKGSKVQYIEEVLKLEKYWLCDNDPRRAVNGV